MRSSIPCLSLVVVAACSGPARPPVPANTAPVTTETYVFRQFSTGLTHTTSTLVTYKLERSGDRASLEVTSRSANHGMRDREKITGWSDGKTVVYSGTARESGGVLKLDLRAGDQTMVYECTRNEHPVAAADAVRGRSPGADECGDTGTWFPAATTKLSILGCREPAEPETEPAPPPETPDEAKWVKELAEREALRTQLSFAAPPGLEYLYINDHCVIQGGDLRRIPADGSVGKIRTAD